MLGVVSRNFRLRENHYGLPLVEEKLWGLGKYPYLMDGDIIRKGLKVFLLCAFHPPIEALPSLT